jgi:hypothetical protein
MIKSNALHQEHAHSTTAYSDFLADFHASVVASIARSAAPVLYKTNIDPNQLWCMYLDSFPAHSRQHYNCHCCKDFFMRYGNLVMFDASGNLLPLIDVQRTQSIDEHAPGLYAMRDLLKDASKTRVTGVFATDVATLGHPLSGGWDHIHLVLPKSFVLNSPILQPNQYVALKRSEFDTVVGANDRFKPKIMSEGLTLLQANPAYKGHAAGLSWFIDFCAVVREKNTTTRINKMWKMIGEASTYLCHPTSAVWWSLLEDLEEGSPTQTCLHKFAVKVDSEVYQRPVAAPKDGTIKQAELLMQQLGVTAESFERRFCTEDDITETVWLHPVKAPKSNGDGIFASLQNVKEETVSRSIPPKNVTYNVFYRDVLCNSGLTSLEVEVTTCSQFAAMITAVHPDATPIIRWDDPNNRNPVSWYVTVDRLHKTRWNITDKWTKVKMIVKRPDEWNDAEFLQFGKGLLVVLDGCRPRDSGDSALFPEIMRKEMHGIRSVIEAYSNSHECTGVNEAEVCGLMFESARSPQPISFKAIINNIIHYYTLDRWE